MSQPIPTGIQLTPLDPSFRENPYPILADLRERDPVHRDTQFGRWLFTRFEDVTAILRNLALLSDPRKANPGTFARDILAADDREPSMLMMDDPGHRRLRQLVRHPFKPNAVKAWRPRVREVAKRIIDPIEDGEFDLIEHIANPIPTVVIAELLGIDPELHGSFKEWSETLVVVSFSPIREAADVAAADVASECLNDFFMAEIAKRRDALGDDLISDMIRADESGDQLTDPEIVSMCNLLLLAGNLTTSDLIGNTVMALLRHPEQLAKLRARPELLNSTIEEVLRYDSPVVMSGRIAHEDMEIGGQKVLKGESLSVSLAAANRDPAAFPNPDVFDIERDTSQLLSFGGGRHFCLGAHLSRLEAAETLSVLLERFPTLDFGAEGHAYASSPGFRGLTNFSVKGGR